MLPLAIALIIALRRPVSRWRLTGSSTPEEWRDWLHENVSPYARMGADQQHHFERDIRFFLSEQRFEGVDGFEVTQAARLSVAAGAALMLFGRPEWEFPGHRTFLLYPYVVDEHFRSSRESRFLGMAHVQGPVVLAAPSVLQAWSANTPGDNVVLHEMAHLFEFQRGAFGLWLSPSNRSTDWSELVQTEMARIRRGDSLLRPYALTNESEFFAVAVENFFERPNRLAQRHPDVYTALKGYFGYDPAKPES